MAKIGAVSDVIKYSGPLFFSNDRNMGTSSHLHKALCLQFCRIYSVKSLAYFGTVSDAYSTLVLCSSQ